MLRAFEWFRFGSDLMGQGLLLLPLVGVVACVRGLLVIVIALMYIVFALGVWRQREWASTLGWVAALVNNLLVPSAVIREGGIGQAFCWLIVPAVMIGYLLSPAGRPIVKEA